MKKKLVTGALLLAFGATAITGGTLAYFSDADADINVMTAGNVKIQQDEWQTNDAGNSYEEYENNKPLFPYTGKTGDDGIADEYNSTLYYPMNDEKIGSGKAFSNANNAIDKIVTVKNTGNQPAYIRTLFAFELSKDGVNPAEDGVDMLNYAKFDDGTCFKWTGVTITVDNVKYAVAEYYYNFNEVDGKKSAIDAKKISYPSLKQLYLSSLAGNEWYDNYGDTYNILVLSQAAQMSGFEGAKDALDTAFAEIKTENATTVQSWFANIADEGDSAIGVDTVHPSAVEGKSATDGKVATSNQ